MRLKFSELFEGTLGTPGYSALCEALTGKEVEIFGYVTDSHEGSTQLLVAEPGGCPDCSPEAVFAIILFGKKFRTEGKPVTLRGTLSYGFKQDAAGNASFLRLERACVATGLPT